MKASDPISNSNGPFIPPATPSIPPRLNGDNPYSGLVNKGQNGKINSVYDGKFAVYNQLNDDKNNQINKKLNR